MAHFAQLNQNNTVLQVIVVNNNDIIDNGQESEAKGIAFCQSLFGDDTKWIQTSYNAKFRKNYAGIGDLYDVDRNAFIPQKPFASWILEENNCKWHAPIPMPQNGKFYLWDETQQQWVEN